MHRLHTLQSRNRRFHIQHYHLINSSNQLFIIRSRRSLRVLQLLLGKRWLPTTHLQDRHSNNLSSWWSPNQLQWSYNLDEFSRTSRISSYHAAWSGVAELFVDSSPSSWPLSHKAALLLNRSPLVLTEKHHLWCRSLESSSASWSSSLISCSWLWEGGRSNLTERRCCTVHVAQCCRQCSLVRNYCNVYKNCR